MRAVRAVAVTVAAMSLVACGSSAKLPRPSALGVPATLAGATTPTVAPTTVAPSTTTTVPPSSTTTVEDPAQVTNDAIVAAYRASWTDFLGVAEQPVVQPSDARLGAHMAGRKLDFVHTSLTKLALLRQHDTGTVDIANAHVVELKGTAAVVAACETDGVAIVDAAGQVVGPATNAPALVNQRLDLVGGIWKVTLGSNLRVAC